MAIKHKIERKVHKIDATDQAPGRLASRIAVLLRGKNKATFVPNVDAGDFVEVENITQMKFTGKKLEKNIYRHYSGYLGGLKTVRMRDVFAKNPGEVLKKAVWNMLPNNRLRKNMMKRIRIAK